jgi:hypothetical protein
MSLLFQPMPLLTRRLPFNNAEYVFELKDNGLKALAAVEHGCCKLISRNGHEIFLNSCICCTRPGGVECMGWKYDGR